MRQNRTLAVLIAVMLVNALSYGTIIPLLYPYAARFGMGPLGLSMLFASFSLAQFLATPLIGRLSDRYGRKPLLLLCVLGTGLGLALFASATNIWVLYIARILDGITGGNLSVAQAIIADTTEGKDRAKGFGMLGAAFGAGFLFGPAVGGLLGQFGMTVPFWTSALIAVGSAIIGYFLLPETLPASAKRVVHKEPLIDVRKLVTSLLSPSIGVILVISLLAALGLNTFILGFQSFTVDVLLLNTTQTGILFAMFGLVSIIMQAGGVRVLLTWFKSQRTILIGSLAGSLVVLLLLSLMSNLWTFSFVLFFFMIMSAPLLPMIGALLTERTRPEDQGGVLGINQSYVSLGQIFGPIMGGLVASRVSASAVFALAGGMYGLALIAASKLKKPAATAKADL